MSFSSQIILCHVKINATRNGGQDKPASPQAVTTTETQKCFAHGYLSPCWLLWQLQERRLLRRQSGLSHWMDNLWLKTPAAAVAIISVFPEGPRKTLEDGVLPDSKAVRGMDHPLLPQTSKPRVKSHHSGDTGR